MRIPPFVSFIDDIEYGKLMIREWGSDKPLDIPRGSILAEHPKKSADQILLPGFHALRYFISGFLTDAVRRPALEVVVAFQMV